MTVSFHLTIRSTCSGILPGMLLVLSGCSSGSSGELVRTEVDIPQVFESDGSTWNNSGAMSDDDVNFLSHVFRARADLADSPELHGEPAVFTNEDDDRRYYWVKQIGDQVSWYCICFEGGALTLTEGDDSPF